MGFVEFCLGVNLVSYKSPLDFSPKFSFSFGEGIANNILVLLIICDTTQKSNQTFTSQVAESHIDTVINARYKRDGKMQWSRAGAHNMLQIRVAMISKQWQARW